MVAWRQLEPQEEEPREEEQWLQAEEEDLREKGEVEAKLQTEGVGEVIREGAQAPLSPEEAAHLLAAGKT